MAKTALILTHVHQDWATSWTGAFAKGLERHGWEVRFAYEWKPCELVVLWGTRREHLIARQKKHGGEVCILERAYLGDRLTQWASVSFGGGLNGRGIFRGPLSDPSRWQKHFADLMQPWRKQEGYALILGQVQGDMSVRGVNLTRFYKRAMDAFKRQGFEVRFRCHPQARNRQPPGVKVLSGELETALAGAAFTVSVNSNAGVLSVLAGIPTVATDQGSMAWAVAGHELEPPPAPDRTAWAHRLAWCQWQKDELASGECWAAVGETKNCEQAA